MRRFLAMAAVLVLCGFAVGASPIEIPLGDAPAIDGVFEPDEWSSARTIDFAANQGVVETRAHLVHDGEQLYVAFEYTANPDGELIIPEILIDADNGKTENWAPDDWWFHIRGTPGSHVILQGPPGTDPDRETLHRAAAIAAYHSKARDAGVVGVSGTRVRDVRKSRGGKAGTVQIRHEKVFKVRPARGDVAGEPGEAPA